ncbi:unnamed protein product [Arabis nemorensis]|uniref:Uncharacterized protein n=1 Tax=Arabis nemorensis TaxID=586526 RepID=A0A565C5G2_9BRAS|nr:unnamed protein product [Arabis nemorensis]
MTDFGSKGTEGHTRVEGRNGGSNNQGLENTKFSYKEGRIGRKDGYRTGAWEGYARGSKHMENGYRVKENRAPSYGRGRSSMWPTPLYHTQNGVSGSKVDGTGKRERGFCDRLSGEDDLLFGGNVEWDDDDLVAEDGELTMEDYDIENHSSLLTEFTNQEVNGVENSAGYFGGSQDKWRYGGVPEEDGGYGTAYDQQKTRDGGSPEPTG